MDTETLHRKGTEAISLYCSRYTFKKICYKRGQRVHVINTKFKGPEFSRTHSGACRRVVSSEKRVPRALAQSPFSLSLSVASSNPRLIRSCCLIAPIYTVLLVFPHVCFTATRSPTKSVRHCASVARVPTSIYFFRTDYEPRFLNKASIAARQGRSARTAGRQRGTTATD